MDAIGNACGIEGKGDADVVLYYSPGVREWWN